MHCLDVEERTGKILECTPPSNFPRTASSRSGRSSGLELGSPIRSICKDRINIFVQRALSHFVKRLYISCLYLVLCIHQKLSLLQYKISYLQGIKTGQLERSIRSAPSAAAETTYTLAGKHPAVAGLLD